MDETLADTAKNFDISERHLRRSFYDTYGVEPQQYLTTRRLLFAKQLLQDTELPIQDVAYSAGFSSPDRLTINMREAYGFTPTRFRKEKPRQKLEFITLRADYRPPFDWQGLLKLLMGRATPFETIESDTYTRLLDKGVVVVTNEPVKNRLRIQISVELSREAHTIIQKVRRLFDLDANPEVISAALQADPFMRQLVKRNPGIRVPGAWDEFELLVRVIIGQQISVAGATTVMKRLIEKGGILPETLASSSIDSIAAAGIPRKRAETIREVAKLVAKNDLRLSDRDPLKFYNQLVAIPGIGAWTAEYALLRILHWPDAFPAGDLGVQKALGKNKTKISETEAQARAAVWRPWRSYATILLWKSLANHGG
ncbi:MAG TPA: AlkA N-terminal domain-containing protein [Patescibacteria group bacterium]|nr:AlkA N-terminal domain-containing protein [Patescibacteria group bacterium]